MIDFVGWALLAAKLFFGWALFKGTAIVLVLLGMYHCKNKKRRE
jgi:hypothetical protein